jgi:hypothetical protein
MKRDHQKGTAMAGKQTVRNIFAGLLIGASMCFGQAADSAGSEATTPDSQAGVQPAEGKNTQASAISKGGIGSDLQNRMSMFFALDEGQAVRAMNSSGGTWVQDNRTWQERMYFHLTNDLTYLERIRLILSMECQLTFSYLQLSSFPSTLAPLFAFYPNDMEISYTFGNLQSPWLQIAAGYFPYKYNPDVKHLGEYLLRSSAYPTFIVSNFEFPMTRELGLHLSGVVGNPAIDQARWDLMLTSETHAWPLQDGTISAVVSNNLFNVLDIGAGVSFQRFFAVDDSLTTPHNRPQSRYFNENGDTSYYTFKATKLMGRATINPLRFVPKFKIPVPWVFGTHPFFGDNDLKIYGEAAVLGYQDYVAYVKEDTTGQGTGQAPRWLRAPKVPVNLVGQYYDSLPDRIPYMVGINLPTTPLISYGVLPLLLTKWLLDETGDDIRPLSYITLIPALASGVCEHFLGWNMGLDVLSLEFEWASQRFPNDNKKAIDFVLGNVPIAADNGTRLTYVPEPQRVRYALYFKKSFMNERFALSGLVARDHMRPAFHGPESKGITDDYLQAKNNWWWTLRLSANF